MLRRVTWRFWMTFAVLLGAYIGLGVWFAGNSAVEVPLYKWGMTFLTFAPLLLMGIYTATGNKWWKNDLGSALAWLAGGITWMIWPFAYALWFHNGAVEAPWLVWIEVSGPAVIALAILRLCYVFLRYHRAGNVPRRLIPGRRLKKEEALCFIWPLSSCLFSQSFSTLSLSCMASGRGSSLRFSGSPAGVFPLIRKRLSVMTHYCCSCGKYGLISVTTCLCDDCLARYVERLRSVCIRTLDLRKRDFLFMRR